MRVNNYKIRVEHQNKLIDHHHTGDRELSIEIAIQAALQVGLGTAPFIAIEWDVCSVSSNNSVSKVIWSKTSHEV